MNKFIFFTFLFLFISTCSFAQFGGLIKKAKKPITSTNKTPASPVESNRHKDGAPKSDSENPIYKAYSKAKAALTSSKGAIEGIDAKQNPERAQDDATKYLGRAKESLDFLNQQNSEKNQAYLVQLNEEYDRLEGKHNGGAQKYSEVKTHKDNIEQYYYWVTTGKTIKKENLMPSYKSYYQHRDAFKSAYPSDYDGDYNQKMVTKIDEFFKVTVYQKVEQLDKKVSSIIKKIHRINGEREDYILNADNYLKDFDAPLQTLSSYKNNLLEDHTSANTLETKINKEKNMLETYINSGKFKENVAKYEQETINNRLLRKGMSDAKVEDFAKSKLAAKYGKALRVTIVSNNWIVEKTAAGIPKHKIVKVDFATKKDDGKCYYVKGCVGRTYEGNGNYGDLYLNIYYTEGEMNCDNVSKNK